jgi:Saxitoxin biosynthesis operon protein SxtJ
MSNHEIRKETHTINKLDEKGLRDFGLLLGGIIIGLFGIVVPLLRHHPSHWAFWLIGGSLCLMALIAPLSLNPIYYAWMRFGLFMSAIETPLILGIVFYLIMVPMGWIQRAMGSDPMRRKLSEDQKTYRVPSQPKNRVSMERPF